MGVTDWLLDYGWIIVLMFFVLMLWGFVEIAQYISEVGLKNILLPI